MECCVNVSIDNEAEYYRERSVTSNRIWKCLECGRQIIPREKHTLSSVQNEPGDKWYHIRTCADCMSVIDNLFCGEWYWGMVWDGLDDHIYDTDLVPWDKIPNLTPAAREKVLTMVENIWQIREQ